jgi:hypothetical protein
MKWIRTVLQVLQEALSTDERLEALKCAAWRRGGIG